MIEKNRFVFCFPCDTQNLHILNFRPLYLKNVFRRDVRYITKNNIQFVNLNSHLEKNDNRIIINKDNGKIIFKLCDIELMVFNKSVEKNNYYSLLLIKGCFEEEAGELESLATQFLMLNRYNMIEVYENEVIPLYSIQIGSETKYYASNIKKEGIRNSIIAFFAAELVKQINISLGLAKENRVIKMNYEYEYFWLGMLTNDSQMPISMAEHNMVKKIANGVDTLYDCGKNEYHNDMQINYYTTNRGAVIFAKSEYYISNEFENIFHSNYEKLFLFALNQRVSIEKNINKIQERLIKKDLIVNERELIENEEEIYNQIISKFSFENPTMYEHYNVFFEMLQKSLQVEKYTKELIFDREALNTEISKIENIKKDIKTKLFWYFGIAGQIVIAIVSGISTLVSNVLWINLCIIASVIIITFLISFVFFLFNTKKVRKKYKFTVMNKITKKIK